jgi:60 kDa SS-A/Ro ribonucleoprotein
MKFKINKWKKLDRVLILGGENYSPKEASNDISIVKECGLENPARTASAIKDISYNNRAFKEQPLLYALAQLSAVNPGCAKEVYRVLPDVIRTGSSLFVFIQAVAENRGFGSGMRRALSKFVEQDVADLAFQVVKYQNRSGWNWRDFLRIVRPVASTSAHGALFRQIISGDFGERTVQAHKNKTEKTYPAENKSLIPEIYWAAKEALTSDNLTRVCELIEKYKLTHEMVNNDLKKNIKIWESLIPHMPPRAILWNLSRFTNLGILKKGSAAVSKIEKTFEDSDLLKKSRLHPWQIFIAKHVYDKGQGEGSSWKPLPIISKLLETGFYNAFGVQKSTGKRRLVCLDVSGSMGSSLIVDFWNSSKQRLESKYGISARNASVVLSMLAVKTDDVQVMAFSNKFIPVNITPSDDLTSAVNKINRLPFDSTDCSLPMSWALKNNIPVDSFEIYTDSETNCGSPPHKMLQQYRDKTGINASMIVCGMSVTDFSVANPNDENSLDIVGVDANVPNVIRTFIG